MTSPPSASGQAELVVLARSESFFTVWPQLAGGARALLRQVATVAEVARTADTLAVIVAAAGVEGEALPLLRELTAAGVTGAVVVGAEPDHRLAAALVREGAEDYFALPGDLSALRAELEERRRRWDARLAGARHAASQRLSFNFDRIIGRSAALRTALDRAARIIPHDRATVLITGETGTGKELLAQAIHYNGPRAAAPFVEVNCTAIPANLLESELFGHEKGAFTDARAAKPGLFEAAHGGTLFLDEIGHLPYELQGKVLKSLEEKQVRRLGALQGRTVDVRIIAATHVDLAQAVRQGAFREDLFYRLSVIPIELPPLRDREDDVLLLTEHFVHTLSRQYGVFAPPIPAALRTALLTYPWPGNVRELRNGVERALLLGDGALDPASLFVSRSAGRGGGAPRGNAPLPFPAPLDQIEAAAARAMVDRLRGNKSAAADALGISRSRLYRLLAEEEPEVAAE